MQSLSSSWRSLANSIAYLIDFVESRLKVINQTRLGRFILGKLRGIISSSTKQSCREESDSNPSNQKTSKAQSKRSSFLN